MANDLRPIVRYSRMLWCSRR